MVERVGLPAVVEQTAEECTELAKAALKLARVMYGENPTPVTKRKAQEDVIEEYSDVVQLARELGIDEDFTGDPDLPDDDKQKVLRLAKAACVMADDCLTHALMLRGTGKKDFLPKQTIRDKYRDVKLIAEKLGVTYDEKIEQAKVERFEKRWEEKMRD